MAKLNQFGSVRQTGNSTLHAPFEAMLTEAVDGRLSAEDQAAFDLHVLGCEECKEMLAEARRGAAWMTMLREHAPEPPAGMLERIFAQTTGLGPATGEGLTGMALDGAVVLEPMSAVAGMGVDAPAVETGKLLMMPRRMVSAFRSSAAGHTLLQPRLAMTAAMAFFSVALTLNLTGVRLSEFRMSDLKPSSVKRSLYEANAHVVRYYTNLRVVYELESRVHDLQRSSDDGTTETTPPADGATTTKGSGPDEPKAADPASGDGTKAPEKQPRRRPNPGTSRSEPFGDDLRVLAGLDERQMDGAPVQGSGVAMVTDDRSGTGFGRQERGMA